MSYEVKCVCRDPVQMLVSYSTDSLCRLNVMNLHVQQLDIEQLAAACDADSVILTSEQSIWLNKETNNKWSKHHWKQK